MHCASLKGGAHVLHSEGAHAEYNNALSAHTHSQCVARKAACDGAPEAILAIVPACKKALHIQKKQPSSRHKASLALLDGETPFEPTYVYGRSVRGLPSRRFTQSATTLLLTTSRVGSSQTGPLTPCSVGSGYQATPCSPGQTVLLSAR